MSATLPMVGGSECCPTTCAEQEIINIPGPPGAPGADGADGIGQNAFTVVIAPGFTMPAEGATVNVPVANSNWMAVGENVFVATAGYFLVTAIPDSLNVTLKNLEDTPTAMYTGNVAPGTVIAAGARVAPGGLQGNVVPSGAAGGDLKGTYPNPLIGRANIKGDLIVGDGTNANTLSKGSDGQIPAYDAALPLNIVPKTLLPNATTDKGVPRYSGTTGKPVPLQTSVVLITDLGSIQTVGGNARGTEAVDLQGVRTNVARVASGANSVIGGGKENTAGPGANSTVGGGSTNAAAGAAATIGGGASNIASATNSTVGGGASNSATAQGATVAGGESNQATTTDATVGGGGGNIASNQFATVAGGSGNNATAIYSFCGGGASNLASGYQSAIYSGRYAIANKYGQVARANERFSGDPGSAQTSEFIWMGSAVNATPIEMFLDGAGFQAVVPNNTSWIFMILMVVRRDTGTSSIYKSEGRISNNAGVTTVAGVTTTEINDGIGLPATPFVVDADAATNALRLTLTGVAANNIRAVAHGRVVEVMF